MCQGSKVYTSAGLSHKRKHTDELFAISQPASDADAGCRQLGQGDGAASNMPTNPVGDAQGDDESELYRRDGSAMDGARKP